MKLLLLILFFELPDCNTNWECTNGGGKTFITPCVSINQIDYYTEHHIDFGDGLDTTFIGIDNPIALCHQTIIHTYDLGIYIVTLTSSFYDSTTNALICTSSKIDTICPNNSPNYIKEIQVKKNNSIYNLNGVEVFTKPKGIYIMDNHKYYKFH